MGSRLCSLYLSVMEEGPIKTEDAFRIYLTCYRVLRAVGEPRADDVLHMTIERLYEQANAIEEPSLRWSFLNNVATHREIIAEWESKTPV
jgi:hypothetical protein